MRSAARTLHQAVWLLCACVLLLPRLSAAEPFRAVDVDGDGQRDRVTVDRQEPSVLRVWLSTSDKTQLIHARAPLLQVVVIDLDGDHRPELIARDRDSHLHVWTQTQKGFRRYRPRPGFPGMIRQGNRGRIEEGDANSPDGILNPTFVAFALTLCASPRAPAGAAAAAALAPYVSQSCRSLTAVDPFAARPPPSHTLL